MFPLDRAADDDVAEDLCLLRHPFDHDEYFALQPPDLDPEADEDAYDAAFMATALSREMAARDRQLGRPADRTLALFDSLVEQATSLLVRADAIFDAYTKIRLVPLNLTVRAKHLGAGGATIGVISNDYNAISAEIKASMDRFVASARQLSAIRSIRFRTMRSWAA